MDSLLRVEHVTISYNGKPVVQDVSFELKQGEILGIVGESGSGKSTVIKAIMGLLGEEGLVTEGDIWYKGENLTNMSEKKLRGYLGKEIGMVFQDCKAALCPVRIIGAQIHEAVSEHEKISRQETWKRAGEIMKKIGLDDSERVTHNIGVVRMMADRILGLQNGQVRDYGATEEVLDHPKDPYTKKLMSSVLHLKRD